MKLIHWYLLPVVAILVATLLLSFNWYFIDSSGKFTHGVASGDPLHKSVVLWTRFVPANHKEQLIEWTIAKDSALSQIIGQGKAWAKPGNDFCVKVIANGLKAGTTYFYQFKQEGTTSPIGRTKTLPNETEKVRIGVTNCSKYTGGYYHAFEAIAQMDDLDVIIHLGDYIYENGPSTPKSSYWQAFQKTGRQHDPEYECHSLQDYRTRYAQYRNDPQLQYLHARYPMIAIWDDHEIAMKPLKKRADGSLEYNGDWEGRKNNSIQAYHEWIPLRPNAHDLIYRSFQLGDLVNLMMVDTRVCCRSEVTKTEESLKDTSRHIVGNKQLQWMFNEVIENKATWNLIGNQLLIANKGRGWNRWQGFPADRNRLFQFVQEHSDLNFLVTTGNAHNPHHYIVLDETRQDTLMHEVLPGSISSGNNAEKARFDEKILAKEAKRLDSEDNVLWYHQDSHGFIVIEADKKQAKVDWYFVSTIWEKEYEVLTPYSYIIPSKH